MTGTNAAAESDIAVLQLDTEFYRVRRGQAIAGALRALAEMDPLPTIGVLRGWIDGDSEEAREYVSAVSQCLLAELADNEPGRNG